MQPHKIVSREEWIEARKAHMAHEKEFTKARDRLVEERQALPWVKVDKDYAFEGPNGKVGLAELFAGHNQLVVQHFMFAPDWDAGCKSCSFWADGFERMIPHLAARDTTLVENTPIDYLDFASPESGLGSKIGLDATNKLPPETHREWGKKIAMDPDIIKKVTENWSRLGLPGEGKPIWK